MYVNTITYFRQLPAEKPVVIMVNQQRTDLVISGRKLKKINLSSLNRQTSCEGLD